MIEWLGVIERDRCPTGGRHLSIVDRRDIETCVLAESYEIGPACLSVDQHLPIADFAPWRVHGYGTCRAQQLELLAQHPDDAHLPIGVGGRNQVFVPALALVADEEVYFSPHHEDRVPLPQQRHVERLAAVAIDRRAELLLSVRVNAAEDDGFVTGHLQHHRSGSLHRHRLDRVDRVAAALSVEALDVVIIIPVAGNDHLALRQFGRRGEGALLVEAGKALKDVCGGVISLDGECLPDAKFALHAAQEQDLSR